jgi:putative ABC transport system substrate-binding protein
MRRREFITLLGGTAASWPLAARAQQPAMPVIGWLNSGSLNETEATGRLAAFLQGLGMIGYVEGRTAVVSSAFRLDPPTQQKIEGPLVGE